MEIIESGCNRPLAPWLQMQGKLKYSEQWSYTFNNDIHFTLRTSIKCRWWLRDCLSRNYAFSNSLSVLIKFSFNTMTCWYEIQFSISCQSFSRITIIMMIITLASSGIYLFAFGKHCGDYILEEWGRKDRRSRRIILPLELCQWGTQMEQSWSRGFQSYDRRLAGDN